LTASSIEILRTTSPGSCAALFAAASTARVKGDACPEADTCCPNADADIATTAAVIVTIWAQNGWCRRITDGSIKEKVNRARF
jgi:hypothetical protein